MARTELRVLRPIGLRATLLAAVALAGLAGGARAQDPAGNELAELRALLRQQAAALQAQQRAMQALQSRLATLEAAQKQAAARTAAARTAAANPAPQVAAAGLGKPGGGENQPNPAGTVEAQPRQEAAQQRPASSAAPAPAAAPLPVASGNSRVKVTISGQINREVLAHSDGTGKISGYFADNNTSSTRLRVLGSALLDEGVTAVSALEFDLRSNSSAAVSRQSENNNGGDTPTLGPFRVRRAEVGVRTPYGTALLGRGSTFADGVAEFDLSGTDVALYAALADSGGQLQFADTAAPYRRAADPSFGQVFDDFDGPRDDRIRYDSPAWRGLTAGGSVGQGGYYDAGVNWAGEVAGVKVASGVAVMDFTGTLPATAPVGGTAQDGSNPATSPFARRVAGSVAVLLPNGFNALVSGGWGRHYGGCCATGLIARDDSTTYYLKLGYQAHLFHFGTTNLSIDGGQTRNRIRDGDVASRYGVQIVQPVIAKGVEVYAGWEHMMLDRDGASFRDGDIGLLGSRVQF